MSPMPSLNPIAVRIYDEVSPIAYGDGLDGDTDYALAQFIEGWTQGMILIESIAKDTDDGPGWSSVMDPNTAPATFLDWLAQFAGVRFIMGESEISKRTRINAMEGLRRGGPDAIKAAVQRTLTGGKQVLFNERQGGNAWKLGVATLTSETPSTADTLSAILSQKPAAITLDYTSASANSYLLVRIAWDTYLEVKTGYLSYLTLRNNIPI